MPRLLFLAVSALALVARPAAGDELAFGVETSAIFDSDRQTGGSLQKFPTSESHAAKSNPAKLCLYCRTAAGIRWGHPHCAG